MQVVAEMMIPDFGDHTVIASVVELCFTNLKTKVQKTRLVEKEKSLSLFLH